MTSTTARDRLGELLAPVGADTAFSASRTVAAAAGWLTVDGVGPVTFPISGEVAQRLCAISEPAQYGQRERTIFDPKVRDTWQVPRSSIAIDEHRFATILRPVLTGLAEELGIVPAHDLRAELHSMLIYGPGQFFAEHQDSEKDNTMLGTLIVGLPSEFTGGSLLVRHQGEQSTFRGSKKALSFVALYGDCRHEVKPIKAGFRAVMTFNLLLSGKGSPPETSPEPARMRELADCLTEHFEEADRLIYLLDHEYTRSGIDSTRLKGADRERFVLLKAAARQARCGLTLGLADLHETWSASDADERWGWGGGGSRYGRATDDGYELEDLIDWDSTLDSWIDPGDDAVRQLGLSVRDDELCSSTPSDALEPYSSEYEGYMGNWGNTLDRWYHRGAVVIWPADREFALRAEANPAWAVDKITARAQIGDRAKARALTESLRAFWDRAADKVQDDGFVAAALNAALLIDDPDLASILTRPFVAADLRPGHARGLDALSERYGDVWADAQVDIWAPTEHRSYAYSDKDRTKWVSLLPELVSALSEAGAGGRRVAARLVDNRAQITLSRLSEALSVRRPSARAAALEELGAVIGNLMTAAATTGATANSQRLIELLRSSDAAVPGLVAALKSVKPQFWERTGLSSVAAHAAAILTRRLAEPARDRDDWSIALPEGCTCEDCERLRAFLVAPAQTDLEWPLAKPRRQHIHIRIDDAELPVSHQTRRTGSPHKLLLHKTEALFKRDHQARRDAVKQLRWLEKHSIPPRTQDNR